MKTKETVYQTYIRIICSNCKNKELQLCDIRRNIKGNLKCVYYEREKQHDGYKKFKGRLAEQCKPLMKLNI